MTVRKLLLTVTLPLVAFACSGPENETKPSQAPIVQAPEAPPEEPVATTPDETMPDDNEAPQSPAAKTDEPAANAQQKEVATFGGGCFWCTEAVLEQLDGVLDVMSGYMGGEVDDPTYKQVCEGTTGHAEVVQVTFDPAVISYEKLLEWFFRSHDPTTLNRQGYDVGTQYRSAIFFHSEAQQRTANQLIQQIAGNWEDPIVTEVSKAVTFWPAEGYHQDYYRGNTGQRYCRAVILPKLEKLGLDVNGKEAAKK
jgi:peptide-methionine (S)-S-oxide reductase